MYEIQLFKDIKKMGEMAEKQVYLFTLLISDRVSQCYR